MKHKLAYIHHIDFLRAIAVLLVIFFHLDISFFSGGFIGVDVFFVISGYLITRNIKFEYNTTKKVNFKKFYIGRIRRLIPSLLLMLSLTFILSFLFYPPSLFSGFVKSMFFSSIALSNFYFLSEANYFDIASSFKPLLHTWSLGIEEQFYLIYPIFIFGLIKLFSKAKHITLTLIVLLLLSFVLNIISSVTSLNIWDYLINFFISENGTQPNISSLQFYLLPFRVFEFLMGAVLVFFAKQEKNNYKYLKPVLSLFGIFIIVISAIIFSSDTKYMSTLNIIPCLGASLFIINTPGKYISSIYNISFFKFTGKISYTLYLFHWPLIVFYKFITGDALGFIDCILLIIITYIFSYFVYTYYENPLRNRRPETRIISNRYLIGLVLFLIFLISFVKIDVIKKDGWLWRLDDETIEFAKKLKNPIQYNAKNWGAAGYKNGYIGGYYTTPPSMIWIGDSHAGHYSYGLDSIMVKKHKKSIYMNYALSVLNLPDIIHKKIDSTKSKEHLLKLLKIINDNPKSVVVISHYWDGHMRASRIKNNKTNKYENFTQDSTGYWLLCEKIVRFSKLVGKRDILVVGENPFKKETDLSYIDNLLIPKYFKKSTSISSYYYPPKEVFEINSFFKNYFEKFKNIHFIDPAEVFCKEGKCLEQKANNIYFSDKNHLSKSGSLKVIQMVEEKLMNLVKNINSVPIKNDKLFDKQKIKVNNYIAPNKTIGHKSPLLKFNGWYDAEVNHIWGSGTSSEISFILNNRDDFKGILELNVGIFKQQEIKVLINGKLIGITYGSGWENIFSFNFDPKVLNTGNNILEFQYSNPKPVNTKKDKRVLALAFRSIKID